MGRVSKRKTVDQEIKRIPEGKTYRAGIYARLSSDQDQKKNESIEVQIEIAKKFVEDYNRENTGEFIEVVQCYTDLGKTGSNFEREGFLSLMQDVRLGDINCVIVKDLSRFGRNYLEAGNYIEKIFPFLGVRFIAVSDGFDTGKDNKNQQISSEIKNLVNDMYAKDISKKAKIQLKQRREDGSYVGGPPPYGYKAVCLGKKRVLIPDENTDMIVRFIYEKYIETENCQAVADELNRRKINPPYVYKKTKEVYYSSDLKLYKGWDRGAIERILKSKSYVGTLVQGKTSITAKNENNRIRYPEEQWIVTKDAHEPLIDQELYYKAEEVRKKIEKKMSERKHPTKDYPLEENIFDGILYCGVCGRKMSRNSCLVQYVNGEKNRIEGYFCHNSGQTRVSICPDTNRISKNQLFDILLPLIRMEFAVFLKKPKHYTELINKRIAENIKVAEAELRDTERKIMCCLEEDTEIYMKYRSGVISQKEYVAFKMKQEEKMKELKDQKDCREKKIKILEKQSERSQNVINALLKVKSGKVFTKEVLEALIEKIYVYPGKRIEVLFTFTSEFMEGR